LAKADRSDSFGAPLHFGGSTFGYEATDSQVLNPVESIERELIEEAEPNVTFNHFLGEIVTDPLDSYYRPKNSFLGEKNDGSEVDAYSGYLRDSQLYDPYHVFSSPGSGVSDGSETASEYERLSTESEPSRLRAIDN
jgi:hypothetical protein